MTQTLIRRRTEEKRQLGEPSRGNEDVENSKNWPWCPSVRRAFQFLMLARLSAAVWSNISDCDETYNYLEPLHYLVHGHGLQTWEYSPAYAIRSYAYLWLYAAPVKIVQLICSGDKILQFLFLRITLAIICSICEAFYYKAVVKVYGHCVGLLTLLFLLFSPGMFISSTAFLPSTFSMYCIVVSMASWWLLDSFPSFPFLLPVFSVALCSLIGWPFAAALGIPVAYDMVVNRRMWLKFIACSTVSLVVCLVPAVMVDSHHYGRLVVAPWNIVAYNVFSQHGPDLYGVEPWTYYFINGFLNFNVVFPLAVASLFFFILRTCSNLCNKNGKESWLHVSGLYIWMAIFFSQPHKEERFLFPVYPLICFSAAMSLDTILKCLGRAVSSARGMNRSRDSSSSVVVVTQSALAAFSVVFILLSFSRLIIVHQGYHAPIDVYEGLNKIIHKSSEYRNLQQNQTLNVCVGKEWYRFPSHFFLPDRCRLVFLKSEFRGQLPAEYHGGPMATRVVLSHVNDLNLEETDRYVNESSCDYLVDLDNGRSSTHEPNYSRQSKSWRVVFSRKFLDSQRSNKFFRAFYVPILTPRYVSYGSYNVLEPLHNRNRRT